MHTISKFADNTKLNGTANIVDNTFTIQNDLDKLGKNGPQLIK